MTNPKHTDTSRSGDLVERLRRTYRKEYVPTGSSVANPLDRLRPFPIAAVDVYYNPDGHEAADHIEALEAENERLRSTNLTDVELEAACHTVGIFVYGPDAERFEKMFDAAMTARTALERIDRD